MTTDTPNTAVRRRSRWVVLAPVLAFIALVAWAFASPISAGPDDDYHLVSTWCADDGNAQCTPGAEAFTRSVSSAFRDMTCFAQVAEASAACQEGVWDSEELWETKRGNFIGEYPPVYYAAMHLLAGDDIEASAVVMRIVNAALFVGLATALALLLPASRRRTLIWGWLIALVPLGMFLIPSNNPSGWALTGVGTAFLALVGWFESTTRRRWALAAIYLIGIVMAAGARGDAAVYVVGATLVAMILTGSRDRRWIVSAVLPAVGLVLAVVLFSTAGQAGVGVHGFSGGGAENVPTPDATGAPVGGLTLAAYNLLMLPFLWTGVWGTWGLGWFDTIMPAIVPWAAVAAFVAVGFAGLGLMSWRKAISVSGVLAVLVVLPTYVLTAGGDAVGEQLQPRYLLPLIVLFAFVLVTELPGRPLRLSRLQTFTVLGALALANLVALQVNIRRYVTGVDAQGLNLDAGAEWWWSGLPVGPTMIWIIGALAYAGMLALLWPLLRRRDELAPIPQTSEISQRSWTTERLTSTTRPAMDSSE